MTDVSFAGTAEERRNGDAIAIDGGYQHRALTDGFVVQRFWHAEKLRMIEKFSRPEKDDRVLDIGCGSGVVSNALREHGARVTGLDGNPDAIAYAQRTFRRDGLDFRLGQVDEVVVGEEMVDRSYCFEVVEHLFAGQVDRLFRRTLDITRTGGTITVTTPNYKGVWPAIEWTLDSLKLVPHLDGDQHVTPFDADRLSGSLERAGWSMEFMTTFSTIAPWVSMLSWGLARKVAAAEDRMKLRWGSILFAVARNA